MSDDQRQEATSTPWDGRERRKKAMIDPTINLGAILQIGTVMIGIGVFAARGERDVALINAEVKSLRESTAEHIGRLTTATTDLRNSVAPLSTLLIRIELLERSNNEMRGVNTAQEARISSLVEALAVLRARANDNFRKEGDDDGRPEAVEGLPQPQPR